MEENVINISAIASMANDSGPVAFIWKKLKSTRVDNRYLERALQERIQQVSEIDSQSPVRRKISDPELLSACREFEKVNVARIAFERMIPVFSRVRSKRVRGLKRAHRTCLQRMSQFQSKILLGSGTLGTPERIDTWNGVVWLDVSFLHAYIEMTECARMIPAFAANHIRFVSDGSHPIINDFAKKIGKGAASFLVDLANLVLEDSRISGHLVQIWEDTSFAESMVKDPIITKELRYFAQLRLNYGPGGRYIECADKGEAGI